MYGLRKINQNGIHYNFKWPLEVGSIAKCPDWNPKPEFGGGLHMLPEGIGDYVLLNGHYWCVVEFDENQMVRIDHDKAKVPECKIVYLSENPDGLKNFFDFDRFNSQTAYEWAYYIGNREIMRDKITHSGYAYWWALNIGDVKIMRDRITDSQYAYKWARDIGDREMMIEKITDSEDAYYWARDIGDKQIMIDRITDSEDAYHWALNIGDREMMIEKITDSACAYFWARNIGDVEMMRNKITDPFWINRFNNRFGEKPCTV